MKFDIDTKIDLNKERLKYDYENLRNLQNSYGYIVVYLSFIGLTFFDFIKHLKTIDYCNFDYMNLIFIISLLVSLVFIFYAIFQFLKLFIPRKVAHDKLPNYIYNTMYNKVSTWAKKNNKNPEEEAKLAYLELLEKAVEINFKLYINKRLLLYKTIKFALISLIPYFVSMILFNLIK
ncbi:MAG: hypothetical protein KAT68_18950 [Bacteroidales bacterium]|nr:hypothetical protein [Bacteroidales bacterium]